MCPKWYAPCTIPAALAAAVWVAYVGSTYERPSVALAHRKLNPASEGVVRCQFDRSRPLSIRVSRRWSRAGR